MYPLDPSRIERYRQELRDEETPEPERLEAQELHDIWQQGNRRRPVPPKLSDRHKADLVDLKRRWITFAAKMGCRDWKGLIKPLSYENKGLGESFMRYLIQQAELQGKPIRSENAIRVHTKKLGGLYRKYNAHPPERSLMDHLRNIIRSEITRKWALRREPKIKPIMGPDFFMYHLYFLWVRDTSAFHIGLDRIDDACLRMFYIWTGCRKHELIYAKPTDLTAKVKEHDEESYAYRRRQRLVGEIGRCPDCGHIRQLFGTAQDRHRAAREVGTVLSTTREYYNNTRINAVVQDAFLSRSTQSPYLAIFNHIGLRLDQNAPKRVYPMR
ncbi:hypothetical protein V8F06_000642 [Rhypophila decipiens]